MKNLKESFLFTLSTELQDIASASDWDSDPATLYRAVFVKVPNTEYADGCYYVFWADEKEVYGIENVHYTIETVEDAIAEGDWIIKEEE